MAKGLVQGLEIIQVDSQQRSPASGGRVRREGLARTLQQQAAIGKTCQWIVESEFPDLLLRRLGLGDIPRDRKRAQSAFNLNHRCGHQPPKYRSIFLSKLGLQVSA